MPQTVQGGEKAHRIGSTTVYPRDDPRARPIEIGASVFVEANKHMNKAAKVYELFLDASAAC